MKKKGSNKMTEVIKKACDLSKKLLEQINEYWYCLAQEDALNRLNLLKT